MKAKKVRHPGVKFEYAAPTPETLDWSPGECEMYEVTEPETPKFSETYPAARDYYYYANSAYGDANRGTWSALSHDEQVTWTQRWLEARRLNEPTIEDEHEPFVGGGVRETQGDRPRFELLLPQGVPYSEQLLTRCAVHMAKGAQKYADRNWEKFSDEDALERCQSSALRHIFQWVAGADDGEDHAAAVVFNLMAAEHVKAKLEGRY